MIPNANSSILHQAKYLLLEEGDYMLPGDEYYNNFEDKWLPIEDDQINVEWLVDESKPVRRVNDRYIPKTEETFYVLGEDSINGITLNEKIRDEDLHEFYIVDREEYIEKIMGWLSEAKESDKFLMKQDIEMLMGWEDEYILTSNSTNTYIGKDSKEFNETCQELLDLHNSLEKE